MIKKNKEIWKEYPLNLGFQIDFRIEFSNLGRMKTFSRLAPKGSIIKGSLQGGFPIFRTTLRMNSNLKMPKNFKNSTKKLPNLMPKLKTLD